MDDDEQVQNFVHNWLQTRPPSFYDGGLKKLPILWQKRIEKGGNYVDKREYFYFVKLCFNKKLKAEVGLYSIHPRMINYHLQKWDFFPTSLTDYREETRFKSVDLIQLTRDW